jgi:cullin-4
MTPVQQLWMLAGRLPGGTASVAAVLKQFCRQQGLQCVMMQPPPPQSAPPNNNNTFNNNAPPNNAFNNNAVPELLELQQRVATLQQQLLQVSHHHGDTTGTTTSQHHQQPQLPSAPQPQQQQAPIPLKSVWEEVVNVDVTPCLAEQLAKFLDSILRSTKKMDQYSARNEDWLSRILNGIFIPLQAKDVFEAFYKRDLAKRLLWNRVVSMDVEKQVCSLLKAECGAGYTSKMEGMFQDVDWSRETMLVYKQSLQAGAPAMTSSMDDSDNSSSPPASTVDVEVQVLTTGYWPVYPQYPNLQLPDNLKIPQEHFANHYKTKYQGRRMTWQYALGHCVVKAHGFAKPYELIVSLCQALVLIQFRNNSEPMTLPQLKLLTGLEDRDELERILQSLALGKDGTRILRKLDHDRGGGVKKTHPNVDDWDQFVVNTQFSSNARRIRIQNVLIKETREERTKTVESVARDRLYLIDAVLVRIMKARKTILHQALIPQVMEQIKVPAQPADIKKRIESLIEREYLERDAKDRNRYNYLA